MVTTSPIGATMSRDNIHDIVTRLRSVENFTSKTRDEWIVEAADEIERLRRTIKVLEYTLEANEDTENE